MSVVRVNKTKDFTVMSNYHLRDKNLSLKAKGLLSQMLSLPDDWDYTVAGLVEINKENETAVKSALDELREYNYLQIHKMLPSETKSGRYEYIYDIYEVPVCDEKQNDMKRYETILNDKKQEGKKQDLEILGVEFQGVENQGQLNTDKQNIKNKTERKYTKKESAGNQNRQAVNFDEIISTHQFENEVVQAINEFIQNRTEMKKALTPTALKNMLNKLERLSKNPEEQIDIINQSIERGYLGIFPVDKKSRNDKDIVNQLNALTAADINSYCREHGYKNVNANEFLGNYKKRGWMVGNALVTDWKSAVDEWEAREAKKNQSKQDADEKIYHRSYMTRCLN